MSGPRRVIEPSDLSWMDRAACLTDDVRAAIAMFFSYDMETRRQAKAICASCPVRDECLDTAMANREEHGVWGGLDETERRTLRNRRRKAGSNLRARVLDLARTLDRPTGVEIAGIVGCHPNTVRCVLREERRRTYEEQAS